MAKSGVLVDRPFRLHPLVVLLAVLAMVLPLTAVTPAQAAVASRVSLGVSPASAAPAETLVLSGGVSPAAAGRRVSLQKLGSRWSTVATVKTNAKGRYTGSVRAGVAGSKTSWRAVALKTTAGAQAISATRTVKVVRQTLSLRAPALVETRLGFTLSGYASPARVGRTVAVQRRSGTSWVEVGRAKQSSAGRHSVRITAGSVGRYTYRAVALSWRRAAAVVSPSRVVTVRAPYILLTRSTAIAAETVKASGKLPGVYSRAVWVQRKSGAGWVTLVKARTTRTGSYSTTFRAPKVGSYAVRALAPKATVAGRARAQYASPAKTLKVVAQTATLTMPATLLEGKTGTATVKFAPVRAGRAVTLQVSRAGVWTALATGKQSSTGAASLTMTAGTPGSYPYRAWTSVSSGAPGFATPTRTLNVTAITTVPAHDITPPLPVTAVTATATATPETSITLSWTNPLDSDLTGVMIRRALGATPPVSATAGTLVTDAAKPATTFTDTDLTSGTRYSYAFFAHDVVPNYSGATNLAATTKTSAPTDTTAPGLVITPHTTSVTATSVALAWDNPTESDFTGVMIRRVLGVIAPVNAADGTLVTDTAKAATTFTDNGLTAGTPYAYAFFAHDAVPNYSGAARLTTTTVSTSGASISGKVTDVGVTPHPLVGVLVSVTSHSLADLVAPATTGADGTYTFTGLPAGADYTVCFSASGATGGSSDASGYLDECYDNEPVSAARTPVVLIEGQAATGIDAALAVGGAVSGKVTDEATPPRGLAGVEVNVFSDAASSWASVRTAADGTWSATGLPNGSDYAVCFRADNVTVGSDLGYIDECYENAPGWDTATPLTVTAGAITDRIDAALSGGGAVSGTVTDAGGTHHGLADVDVSVYASSPGANGGATTAADGSYKVTGLPAGADYSVCFYAPGAAGGSSDTLGYLDQCFDNQPTTETPTPVEVTLGATRTGTNAALSAAGAVSGTVTDAGGTQHGLAGVLVSVSSESTWVSEYATTAADGTYTVGRLTSGSDYRVCFTGQGATGGSSNAPVGYIEQCYNQQASGTPTPVEVTAGETRTGINAALVGAGAISGVVTEAGGTSPGLANVRVRVESVTKEVHESAWTETDGTWFLTGLAAGTDYTICFSGESASGGSAGAALGYVEQCYNQQAAGTPTPVTVTKGEIRTGINAALIRAGAISGTVTEAGGTQNGLSYVDVSVTSVSEMPVLFTASTENDGTWSVTGLMAGTYTVCFTAFYAQGGSSDDRGYVDQCYDNQPTTGTPKPVTVVLGENSTGINAALAVGVGKGGVSGTVTEAGVSQQPLKNVIVTVRSVSTGADASAYTAADGSWSLDGILAGTDYQVCFYDFDATGGSADVPGYFDQCYNDQSQSGTPTPVTVEAGETTTGLDAVLDPAGAVSGTVTEAGGTNRPLANIEGWVSSTTEGGSSFTTTADGTYTVTRLVPGAIYEVCFTGLTEDGQATGGSSDATGYVYQCYDSEQSTRTPTPVMLTPGETRTGIDAALEPGGAVSGMVIDAAGTNHGLANVDVMVRSESSGTSGNRYATTAADGSYLVLGLAAADDYTVCFETRGDDWTVVTGGSSDALGYVGQCFDAQPTSGTPTPVIVGARATRTGVSASLVPGGAISGTVTEDAAGGHGLADVQVLAYSELTSVSGYARTAADGSYTLSGLPAGTDFRVCFYPPYEDTGGAMDAFGYVRQCFNNKLESEAPNLVAVTSGEIMTGISATLATAGAVSGRVTDDTVARNGLANVSVWVRGSSTNDQTKTAADGSYTVKGLPAGNDYSVCFTLADATVGSTDELGYVDECYDDQLGSGLQDLVTVTSGEVTSGINAGLADGGGISGTVTDDGATAQGLANVRVNVYSPSTGRERSARTDADGGYTVTGLPEATDYKVCFDQSDATGGSSDEVGYLYECFENQPNLDSASQVSVTVRVATAGVDAALAAAGAISGTVTDDVATPHGLANVWVTVRSLSTGVDRYAWTDADGNYTMTGLPAGSDYVACFYPYSATGGSSDDTGYVEQCYDGQPTLDLESATRVTVVPGETAAGIDAALAGHSVARTAPLATPSPFTRTPSLATRS